MSNSGTHEGTHEGAVTTAGATWAARCISGAGGRRVVPLPAEDLAAFAAELRVRTLPAGAAVFDPRDRPEGVWIIRDGVIELAVDRGGHRLVAQVLRSGDVFGDLPLLLDQPPPYQARAARAVTCLLLPSAALTSLVDQRPAILRLWVTGLAARFAASQARVLALLDGSVLQRVAALLLHEARDGVVDLPQATLAAMIGIPRPSLNRILRKFESTALVDLRYRQVRILSPARLATLTQDPHADITTPSAPRRAIAPEPRWNGHPRDNKRRFR